MKTIIYISTIFSILTLGIACTNQVSRQINKPLAPIIDTTKSIKIGNFWATPKKSFEFNAVQASDPDTLTIVTCSKYVYSPFGEIKDGSVLKSSLLKNFDLKTRIDTLDIGPTIFQVLKLKNSRLILSFDNDPEASTHSYIFKGEINDPEALLDHNIRVGMSIEDFYKIFFDYFPGEVIKKYKFLILASCVDDIKHIYIIKNGKIASIVFKSDSYERVDY